MSRQTDRRTDEKDDPFPLFSMYPPFFPDAFKNSRRGLVRLPVFFHRAIINPFSPSVRRSFRFLLGLEKEKEEEETANYSSVFLPVFFPFPPLRNVPFLRLLPRRKTRETTCGFKRRRREKRRSLARLLSFYSCIYTCMKFTQERIHRRKPLPEMTFRNSLIATEFPRLGDDCPEKKSQNR